MRMSISPRRATRRRSPTPRLVFANGLGFEGWIDRLVKASGTKAPTIVATKGVKPRKAEDDHGHGHGDADPHAWQSVANAKIYVANIRDALEPGRSGREGQLRGECRGLSRPSSTRSTPR